MPRLNKISTRKGDDGSTGLAGGERVSKDSLRVNTYGTVDELNSFIGLAIAHGLCDRLMEALPPIQNELLHLGSDLAFREEDKAKYPKLPLIESRHVETLDSILKELNAVVGPLENFILPGGSIGSSYLHVARTVCRRAERLCVALSHEEAINPHLIPYLNRLSDVLFVMARYENKMRGVKEPLWDMKA